jgi:hypothetical protein
VIFFAFALSMPPASVSLVFVARSLTSIIVWRDRLSLFIPVVFSIYTGISAVQALSLSLADLRFPLKLFQVSNLTFV